MADSVGDREGDSFIDDYEDQAERVSSSCTDGTVDDIAESGARASESGEGNATTAEVFGCGANGERAEVEDMDEGVRVKTLTKIKSQRRWFLALAHTEEDFEDLEETVPTEGVTEGPLVDIVGDGSAHSQSTSSLQNFLAELDAELTTAANIENVVGDAKPNGTADPETLAVSESAEMPLEIPDRDEAGSADCVTSRSAESTGKTSPRVAELRMLHKLVSAKYEEVFSRIELPRTPLNGKGRRRGRVKRLGVAEPENEDRAASTMKGTKMGKDGTIERRRRQHNTTPTVSGRSIGTKSAGGRRKIPSGSRELGKAMTPSARIKNSGTVRSNSLSIDQRLRMKTPSSKRSPRAGQPAGSAPFERDRVHTTDDRGHRTRRSLGESKPSTRSPVSLSSQKRREIGHSRQLDAQTAEKAAVGGLNGKANHSKASFATTIKSKLKPEDLPQPIETEISYKDASPGSRASQSATSSSKSSASNFFSRYRTDSTTKTAQVIGRRPPESVPGRRRPPTSRSRRPSVQSARNAGTGGNKDMNGGNSVGSNGRVLSSESPVQKGTDDAAAARRAPRRAAVNPFGKLIGESDSFDAMDGGDESRQSAHGTAESIGDGQNKSGDNDSSVVDDAGQSHEAASSFSISLASNEASLTSIDTQIRSPERLDSSLSAELSQLGTSQDLSFVREQPRERTSTNGTKSECASTSGGQSSATCPTATPKARNPFAHITEDIC